MLDAITVIIESKKKGRLRDALVDLREAVRVDPFAIEELCEFQPSRAADLICLLIEEVVDGHRLH